MSADFLTLLQNPALLASLHNTLTPAGLLSQGQAEQQDQANSLAAATKAAAEASTAAGAQYQQAAAAPVQQVDPMTVLSTNMAAAIGKSMTGDTGFTDRAAKSLDDMHADLVRSRVDNLTRLKDQYDHAATVAEAAGNTEATIKARTSQEKVTKALDALFQSQRDQATSERDKTKTATELNNRLAEIRATGEEARKTNAAKGGTDNPELEDAIYGREVFTTPGGVEALDLTNFKGVKATRAALVWAARNGKRAIDGAAAKNLKTAGEVLSDMDNITSVAEQMLPHVQGKTWGQAMMSKGTATLRNAAMAAAGMGAPASFGNSIMAGIRNIQTLAGGQGSGFRLTDREVKIMKDNWPKGSDTFEQATDKLAWEKAFLLNKENAFLGKPAIPMPQMSWNQTQTNPAGAERYDTQGNKIGGQ